MTDVQRADHASNEILRHADSRYRAGDYAAAAEALAPFADLSPPPPGALRMLGLCRLRLGATQTALDLLARARRRPTTRGRGCTTASACRRPGAMPRRWRRSAPAATCCRDTRQPELNLSVSSLALGDVPDEAFPHWVDGHRELARFQPFSRDAYAAFVDATIGAFTAERMASGARADNRGPAPVFIVGLPRSGTTLVEHILDAHADVFGAGERVALAETFAALGGAAETPASAARALFLEGVLIPSSIC